MTPRRIPIIVLVVAALAVLALVEVDDGAPDALEDAVAVAMPTVGADSALSSAWFCAASSTSAAGRGDLTVTVANAAATPRRGTVTWVPDEGQPVTQPVDLGPHQALRLDGGGAVDAAELAAIVELDGGGITVEHAVQSPRGTAVAPCASATSDRWYLANGTTARDASQVLVLFNPFPDDAIVDVSFATDQGRDQPDALQGLPLRARSVTRVNVTDMVRRREVTATSVVARRGRLVVDRLQSFDGSDGRTGLSLTLAAPAPAEVWTFPAGVYEEGLTERWRLFNPGERDAVVIIEVVPDTGEIPIPVERTVPARSQITVDAAESATVPAGTQHSSTVRSINGAPVVAERELAARAPSPRRGWSSMLGSPLSAQRWVLATGPGAGEVDERVVVHNPGAAAVRFSVTALASGSPLPVARLQDIELGPAQRRVLRMSEMIERSPLPLVVEAEAPVVVERDLSPAVDPGISTMIGIPDV